MSNIVLKIEERIEEFKKQLIAFEEIALALKGGRGCLHCGKDISERRSDAKYCSKDCRWAYHRAKQEEKHKAERGKEQLCIESEKHKAERKEEERNCLHCSADISERRSDAIYCSSNCRHAYNRALALKGSRNCLNCGADISEKRIDARYCSKDCRLPYHRAKQEEKQGIKEAPKRGAYENVGKKKRSGMSRAEYLAKYKQVVKELKAGESIRRAAKLCDVSAFTAAKVSKTMQAELLKTDEGKIEKLLLLIKEAQDLQFSSQKAKAAMTKANQLLEQAKSFFQ